MVTSVQMLLQAHLTIGIYSNSSNRINVLLIYGAMASRNPMKQLFAQRAYNWLTFTI